jgi:plastocyanin
VTFINRDATAHTATSTSAPPVFDTGTLDPGQSRTIALAKPGIYTYYCHTQSCAPLCTSVGNR